MAEAPSEQITEGTGESGGPPPLSHKVPPPQDMSKSKLDWLLQINEDYFQDQLKTVGFGMQNLTPMEAARVLYKAETRMGHAIPEEDLKAGKLAQYLQPEDFTPIQNVREVRESNVLTILKALEQPNVEIDMLIQQQKMRYENRLEGDEDEPDLPLLSTLDFAALKDVRETGEEYCRSFTKLLHETPGLQPGYLPQPDALYLLSGAMHMLTLGSYLEERAAKLRREALGRIQVALAGSAPNSMYTTIDSFFGYQPDDESEDREEEVIYSREQTAGAESTRPFGGFPCGPSTLPTHLSSVRGKTDTVVPHPSGSESEAAERSKQHINPTVTKAIVFKPGSNERSWTRTGLPKEFLPTNLGAGNYGCPMCPKYQPRSNLDTVATHIRRDHLNISMGCYFCNESFFSSEGWKKHNFQKHGKAKVDYVPEGTEEPVPYKAPAAEILIPDNAELAEVKQEEQAAIEQAAGLAQKENLNVESDFTEEIMEIVDDE